MQQQQQLEAQQAQEPVQNVKSPMQPQLQLHHQHFQQTTNKINSKLNGFLNLKTPLIG